MINFWKIVIIVIIIIIIIKSILYIILYYSGILQIKILNYANISISFILINILLFKDIFEIFFFYFLIYF